MPIKVGASVDFIMSGATPSGESWREAQHTARGVSSRAGSGRLPVSLS